MWHSFLFSSWRNTTIPASSKLSCARLISPLITLVAFITLISAINILIPSSNVYAETYAGMSVTERAKSWLYYNALSTCVTKSGPKGVSVRLNNLTSTNYEELSSDDAASGDWFANKNIGINPNIGFFLKGAGSVTNSAPLSTKGSQVGCGGENIDWISDAMKLWGYETNIKAICDFGAQRKNLSECINGDGSLYVNDFTDMQKMIKTNVYAEADPAEMNIIRAEQSQVETQYLPERYIISKYAFFNGCLGSDPIDRTTKGGFNDKNKMYYDVRIIDTSGKDVGKITYEANGINSHPVGDDVYYYADGTDDVGHKQCWQIQNDMDDSADAYLAYYTNLNLGKSPEQRVSDSQGAANVDNQAVNTCGSEAGGLGWLGCPIISMLSSFNKGAWFLTKSLLQTSPLTTNDQNGSPTAAYQAWALIRNLANILFILVFLVTIFSQITNIGLDNYGIKKILPKLIIGAILVNLSFIIMQVVVDLTNIVGIGLYDFMINGIKGNITDTSNALAGSAFDMMGFILGAGGAVGIVAIIGPEAAIWLLVPILVMAALAMIAAILSLLFRLAIIPILAILAPLAFVAYLLPNTTSLFKKWKDALVSMLVIFPLAALIFGGSQVASVIFATDGSFLGHLLAMVVLSLPLGILPFLVSKSGSIVGAASGFLVGMAASAKKPIGDFAGDKKDIAQAKRDEGILSGNIRGNNWFTRRTVGARNSLIQSRIARKGGKTYAERNLEAAESKNLSDRLNAPDKKFLGQIAGPDQASQNKVLVGARTALKKKESEMLEDELSILDDDYNNYKQENPDKSMDEYLEKIAVNQTLSEGRQTAAVHRLAKDGRSAAIRRLSNGMDFDGKPVENVANHADKLVIQKAINANAGALISKAPDLIKGEGPAFNNIKGADIVNFSTDTAEAHMRYLSGLYEKAVDTTVSFADREAAGKVYQHAETAFNSAIATISANPTIQIAGDVGQTIASIASGKVTGIDKDFADRITKGSGVSSIDLKTGMVK